MATTDSFKAILKRSNSKIQEERANRIAKRAKSQYNSLLAEADNKVMDIQDKLEAMADISTSNSTTSSNAIKGASFDAKEFVNRRAKLRLDLVLAQQELEVLKEDESFYN